MANNRTLRPVRDIVGAQFFPFREAGDGRRPSLLKSRLAVRWLGLRVPAKWHEGQRDLSVQWRPTMHSLRPITLGFSLFLLAGCLGSGYPIGVVYNGTSMPHQMDRMEATGPARTGDRMGQACATGIMGAVAWGDATLDAAKKAGAITEVHSVEFKPTVVAFGIYYQACTVVHGK
jgi:hypothetical protein